MSLLTGNIQTAAWMRLRRFGIEGYFRPGAFGDDHHDPNELGAVIAALGRRRVERGWGGAEESMVPAGNWRWLV